jgi:hypothetical protein
MLLFPPVAVEWAIWPDLVLVILPPSHSFLLVLTVDLATHGLVLVILYTIQSYILLVEVD